MTGSTKSNTVDIGQTLVNLVTSKISPTIPNDPFDQVNDHLGPTLGQNPGQKPYVFELSPELLPRSPNFT
jgi:hypothetical protein